VQLVTSTADFTRSVPAALAQTARFWETNEGERLVARQHGGTAIISEGHKNRGGKYQNSRCSVKMLSCQRYSYSYSYSAE